MKRISAPLVGYRVWNVRNGRLESVSSVGWYGTWDGGQVAEAYCFNTAGMVPPHEAPSRKCRCGIYAVDSLRTAVGIFPDTLHRASSIYPITGAVREGSVLGAVQLWGSAGRPVIVGEISDRWGLQYRAPYARIIALAADEQGLGALVGETLGIPVVPPQTLEWYAREHGEQLRPQARRNKRQWVAFGVKVVAGATARLVWRFACWATPRAWAGVLRFTACVRRRLLGSPNRRSVVMPRLVDVHGNGSCPHIEAGVRLNELSEVDVCAACGIAIEDLDADEAMGGQS